MCGAELLWGFGRRLGPRAEGRGLSTGAVGSVGAASAARAARGGVARDSGTSGTGTNRLTWLPGLVLLSRQDSGASGTGASIETLLKRRRLVFDGVPDEFPVLVVFPALVNLERGLIDRAAYSVDERPENRPADGPRG